MRSNHSTIGVLIAGDDDMFHNGLRRLLEADADCRVLGEAHNCEQTVKLVQERRPDVLLLDLELSGVCCLKVIQDLERQHDFVRTIILAGSIRSDQILRSLQLGAWGIVLKQSAFAILLKGIRAVMAGEHWLGHDQMAGLVEALHENESAPIKRPGRDSFGLTERELEIISAVVAGYSNPEIARRCSISEATVKHHLTKIFDKLGVWNRLELCVSAMQLDLTANLTA